MTQKRDKKPKKETAPRAEQKAKREIRTSVTKGTLWDAPGVADAVERAWDSPGEESLRRDIATWVGRQDGTVLDVGCGTARMEALIEGDFAYIGADNSPAMLRIAEKRIGGRASVGLSDAVDLTLPDKSVETSLCLQVLRHVDDYEKVLQELERVTAGQVFIVDAFSGSIEHRRGTSEFAGETFVNNVLAAEPFRASLERAFPGWTIETKPLVPQIMGWKLEAPK